MAHHPLPQWHRRYPFKNRFPRNFEIKHLLKKAAFARVCHKLLIMTPNYILDSNFQKQILPRPVADFRKGDRHNTVRLCLANTMGAYPISSATNSTNYYRGRSTRDIFLLWRVSYCGPTRGRSPPLVCLLRTTNWLCSVYDVLWVIICLSI